VHPPHHQLGQVCYCNFLSTKFFAWSRRPTIILNLGHISYQEMKEVVPAVKQQGVNRIVCDHPFFSRIDIAQQVELADQGVRINFTAGELLPRWWRVSSADFAAAIRKVGVRRSVISSDCGQLHNPPMSKRCGSRVNCSSKRSLRSTTSR
jgi:Family of unknown function (DUF6282)